MARQWKLWRLVPALALSVALTGCEPNAAERAAGPSSEPDVPERVASTVVTAEDGGEYTLIEGRIPSLIENISVSSLVGILGGTLRLAGHELTIPRGLLNRLTLVTLTLKTDGYVEVDLRAIRLSLFGLLDIGSRGFDRPVPLTLSYAWASNVDDPQDLVVLRMDESARYGDGDHEPLPTVVNEATKTVTVELDHFSAYCMAAS